MIMFVGMSMMLQRPHWRSSWWNDVITAATRLLHSSCQSSLIHSSLGENAFKSI